MQLNETPPMKIFCVRYCWHIPPCFRKTQSAKYRLFKTLEN